MKAYFEENKIHFSLNGKWKNAITRTHHVHAARNGVLATIQICKETKRVGEGTTQSKMSVKFFLLLQIIYLQYKRTAKLFLIFHLFDFGRILAVHCLENEMKWQIGS